MAVVVRLLGWTAEGLRCPDHHVWFERPNGAVPPIALIQMPNGTGKTTTLELLRAALSGSATTLQPDAIRAFAKRGNERGYGGFQVALMYNDRRLTIRMSFHFEEGTVRYTTTVGSGMREGFAPPHELRKFLGSSFVRFFVFDGELAERLLSRKDTDAENVIEHLFQLGLFEKLEGQVQRYWQQQTAKRGAVEDRGLSRRRGRVDALRHHLGELRKLQGDLLQRRETTEIELLERKRRFETRLAEQEQVRDRLNAANASLQEARLRVQTSAQAALAEMRNPHALSPIFAREMLDLKESLDRVKLPESTAREFFEELAQEDNCVCGREMDEHTRMVVRERSTQYLASDDVGLLNGLKHDIAKLLGPDTTAHEQQLIQTLTHLRDCCRRETELQTELDTLQQEGITNDPALDQARKDIEELTRELGRLQVGLNRFEDPTDSAADEDTLGIKVVERRLEDAEKKLAEITDTLHLRKQRDVLIEILRRAHANARARISREVCDQANALVGELMPHNVIRIKEIDRCLVLQGQEGGSVGETLSVGYAFLATLFNRAEHELPFVVDSPANPIDLAVRARVAELIPSLSQQFAAFTISSEREGFLPALERAAGSDIEYITLFRKGPEELERVARMQAEVNETVDGLSVRGRDFFTTFHVESEVATDAV